MQTAIVADSRERESRVRAALLKLGVRVDVERMPVADYRADGVLIERKSVKDLHLSIIQHRFWPQVGRLSRTARMPFLLVEGEDLDAGPLHRASVRGALLAVAELGISVVRSRNPEDSALWLKTIAERSGFRLRAKRTYAARGTSPEERMLAAVPGISEVTARALLHRFGSVRAVLNAGPDEWLSIPGVGPKRVQALQATLGWNDSSISRAPRARRDLST